MRLCVLDTDHLSLLQRGHSQVAAKVLATPPEFLAITIITAEEQLRGRLSQIRKARDEQGRIQAYLRFRETLACLARVHVLDYTREAEAEYQILRRQKLHIDTQDLRIAATVRALNAVLITRNHTDFSQVPGLLIEDWSRA